MITTLSPLFTPALNPAGIGAVPTPLGSFKHVFYWTPLGGNTVSGGALGGAFTGQTTISTAITFGATTASRFRRALSTTTAAINQPSGLFQSYARYARADSNGGWDAQIIFSVEGTHAAGHGVFCGFSPNVTALSSADITTQVNCIGVGFTAADAANANWSIVYNDGSGAATMTPIVGMARSNTAIYRMRISLPRGATAQPTIAVYDAISNATYLAPTTLSSNLPAANTALSPGIHGYTGASSTALVTAMTSIYVECDY